MSKKFEKLLIVNMWISKYLLFASPVAIGTVILALFVPEGSSEWYGFKSIFGNILGLHFLVWFISLVYFLVSLFLWRTFREKILTILTFSQERDERESYISGRASRGTFYSTLAALILLFFLSGLEVHIYKKPKEEAIDGKRGTITISYKFEFVNSAPKNEESSLTKNENILKVDGIPFTQESILLFLILYHVASYHVFSRRRLKE